MPSRTTPVAWPAAIAAMLATLLGAGCAELWGFADLERADAGFLGSPDATPADAAADDSPLVDGAALADAAAGCLLTNPMSCKGQCTDPGYLCGCVPNRTLHTAACTSVGQTKQDNGCPDGDGNCEPGLGCDPTTRNCEKWCRPMSTPCPANTTCRSSAGSPSVVVDGQSFYYCR